jgi:phage terminase small subunit
MVKLMNVVTKFMCLLHEMAACCWRKVAADGAQGNLREADLMTLLLYSLLCSLWSINIQDIPPQSV